MTTSAHTQKLLSDGVHKIDYFTQRCLYQNCPSCNEIFTMNQLPNLIQCGHVCCDQCLNTYAANPCGACNKPKILIIPKYKTLFGLQTIQDSSKQNRYDFQLKMMLSARAIAIRNQPPNTTFGQILMQFEDFVEFQKRTPGTAVCIVSKTCLYNQIKDRFICQFKTVLPNRNKHSNSIVILNKWLGGNQTIHQ